MCVRVRERACVRESVDNLKNKLSCRTSHPWGVPGEPFDHPWGEPCNPFGHPWGEPGDPFGHPNRAKIDPVLRLLFFKNDDFHGNL